MTTGINAMDSDVGSVDKHDTHDLMKEHSMMPGRHMLRRFRLKGTACHRVTTHAFHALRRRCRVPGAVSKRGTDSRRMS